MSRKRIMVVEDNSLNREMLCEILSQKYAVVEAENGQQALDILNQNRTGIDLILLDIMMPVMDGLTFLKRIGEDEELALIPVIVMTQSDSEKDEVAALSCGATDFVPKPYRPQIILHRVASIIKLRETAAMVNQFQYDRLTGVYSKEFFYQKVREQLAEHPDEEYNLICSNIENFKLYNDIFGIPAGNLLLKQFAEIARKWEGDAGFCGRYEADRFIFLQKREREEQDRELMAANAQSNHIIRNQNVVIKWGIYEITDKSLSVEQMCDRAFLAVDSIKGQYNEWVAVYDDTLRSRLLREQAITETMETALEEGQFSVYFQPKYSLHDDELAGAEALVRWIHPEWGFMSPGEFIPLFEKNGFITRLDQYVWEQVCMYLREWREKGYDPIPVSVNVSRADVYQSDLIDTLLELLKKYGIKPEQLHLELTESAYTENPAQIIDTVDQLRKLGFIVEMDDFGSGYSSLNMLNQMKLDILKLDMKFIQNETAKPTQQGILRFIVSLARWMNMSVVAEGVETRSQLERLREIGCDYVQGYLFAKPMPGQEFEELLKKQHMSSYTCLDRSGENGPKEGILIIDEDDAYRKQVCAALEEQYQIWESGTVTEGLELAMTHGPEISLIMLSAGLPDRGAAVFLEKMRRDLILWRVPVLSTMPLCDVSDELIMELDTEDFLCKRHPMRDVQRRVNRLISIAACVKREQAFRNEAYRDFLTGLLNRRGFFSAVDALRKEDLPIALYFFDLDNMKKVNDRYGHEAGDEMLRQFADILRAQTRKGDILCRYGGDEFAVVLRCISSKKSIFRKGEEICRECREIQFPDGTCASASCGIVMCEMEEYPSAKVLARADQALYRAKQGKKGGCCLWEEE